MDLKLVSKFNSTFFSYLSFILLSLLLIPFSDVTQPSPEFALFGTLFEGNFLNLYSEQWPYFDPKIEGRYQPLVGIHLNLIFLYESLPTIFDVYLIQSILSILFIVSLIFFLKKLNLKINPFYFSLFVIMPSYVFSFYHPFLVESYSLLSLVFFFHILFLTLSHNSIRNYLLLIFLLINLLISKLIFFSISIIFSLSYFFCMFCIKREFNIRKLVTLSIVLVISISFFILNVKISGTPTDQISLNSSFFYLFLKTDILLYLFSILTVNFFIIFIIKNHEFNSKDIFILSMSVSSVFYFFLLILYGKYDGYQQVISYFLFIPIAIFSLKKDRLFQNIFIKFFLLIIIIYFLYYYRSHLVITLILFFIFYFYCFIYKNFFQQNTFNIFRISIVILSIWSLLIPGIFIHINHKFNSISVNSLIKEIKDFSVDNNEIYINHVSYLDNCNGSISHDFQFAERINYYINDSNFYLIPMQNYKITDCIKAFSNFEKNYSDLDDEIFKYYKKRYIKYPNFIFIRSTNDLNSFFNQNFDYDLDYYNVTKYETKNNIWNQLVFFASFISSYQPTQNPNYFILKLKD